MYVAKGVLGFVGEVCTELGDTEAWEDDSILGMHSIFGLVKDDRVGSFHDLVGDFAAAFGG